MSPPATNAKWEMSDGFQKYSQPDAIIMHDTSLVSSIKSAQHAFQAQMRSPLLSIISVDVGKLSFKGFLGWFFFFFLMCLTQGQTELEIQPRYSELQSFLLYAFLSGSFINRLGGKTHIPGIRILLHIFVCLLQNIEFQIWKWSPVAIEKTAFHT